LTASDDTLAENASVQVQPFASAKLPRRFDQITDLSGCLLRLPGGLIIQALGLRLRVARQFANGLLHPPAEIAGCPF
jgi:hypothetical protein